MEVSWAAAARADRQSSGELGFSTGREGGSLLVAHVDPFYRSLASEGVAQAVQGVSGHTVNAFHASGLQRVHDHFGYSLLCHEKLGSCVRVCR